MMRPLVVFAFLAGVLVLGAAAAEAHYCPDGDPNSPDCTDTPPSQEWRDNYIPVFDAPDRHEHSRTDYQRWRNEHGCTTQWCTWADFSISLIPADGDPGGEPRPNEVHVGATGNHSLTEGAHQSEDHNVDGCDGASGNCEGIHDAHGGTAYADVCLTQNSGSGGSVHDPDSCDEGVKDTEIGVIIVDKNPCGTIPFGFPVPCMDEYHVIRPFDEEYSERQREQDRQNIERIPQDPNRYVCGNEYAEKGEICPYIP